MSRTTYRIVSYECRQLILRINAKLQGKLPPQLPIQVTTLQKEVGLLEEAWSEAAGRNLLGDILRILNVMEPLLPSDLTQQGKRLKARVVKALGKFNPTKSKYKNVLCLGYRVQTTFDKFMGHTDDWQDMNQKCDDMKAAIRAAFQLANPHNSDGTMLKIFMAPEFFFRGRNGAYDHADVSGQRERKAEPGIPAVQAKLGIMDLMEDEIHETIYKDWLFVLGTAIAATKLTRTVCRVCSGDVEWVKDPGTRRTTPVCKTDKTHSGTKEKIKGAFVDNVAFVQKEKERYIVTKELVSGIDYITDKTSGIKDKVTVRNEQLDVIRHPQPSGYDAATDRPTKFQDERMGGGVFIMDGVTIGLEVCLDHAATRAASGGRLSNASNIQVHLVPSAGMTIGALRTKPGGIVFNVDGGTPHVQVVGSGSNPEIRYDIQDDFLEPKSPVNRADAVFELKHFNDLNESGDIDSYWKHVAAPKEGPAPRGKLICYGPYALP